MSWQPLLANLALVAILMIAFDCTAGLTVRWQVWARSVTFGLLMGGGAILSMGSVPAPVPGVLVDLRAPFVAAAGLFGGLPAAAVSGAVALAFRAYLGGQGMFAGLLSLLLAVGVGIASFYVFRNRDHQLWHIVAFSIMVAASNTASFFALPSSVFAEVFREASVPLALLTFAGSFLIGVLFRGVERRRALEQTNLIYRAMVEQLPDNLNFKDVAGRFVVANPATAKGMGKTSSDDLIGRTDFDFHTKVLAERYRSDERQILLSGETIRHDEPFIDMDGKNGWLSTLKVPLKDKKGRLLGIITHNRDVTAEKQNSEAKQHFIAAVSHELRTPLTSIRGALGLLKAGAAGALPPKAAKLISIAEANSTRLILLVNDILDIEKLDAGKMVFDISDHLLHPLMEQAISANAGYLSEKNIQVELAEDLQAVMVTVDPDRLHQVMANLLSNALKFSHACGRVTVGVSAYKGLVRISVHDDGPGIPAAFQSRVFNKLEQAETVNTRSNGGTGLGLSIAKSMVEKMNGRIHFETSPYFGTTFHVDLPGFALPERQSEAVAGLPAAAITELPHVLILDDDEEILSALTTLLASVATITACRSLADARMSLTQRPVDLIVLDIWLPDGSGHVLLNELPQELPVVVFSNVPVDTHMGSRVIQVISKERTRIEAAAQEVSAVVQLLGSAGAKNQVPKQKTATGGR